VIIYNFYANKLDSKLLRQLFIFIVNIFIIPCIVLWTFAGILLFPLGLIVMQFFQGYSVSLLTRRCIWIYGRVWKFIFSLFVDFQKIDVSPEKFEHPGVIVVNHRSFFDTYCMNMLPIYDICFAVRAWPFKIFFYRLFMNMAGYLNIESDSWEEMVNISKTNFNENSFVLFFPEGHRSKNRELTNFYSGAFKLAIENNVPIIPICLTGTGDLLPPNRPFLAPAKIKIQVLDQVWPDEFEGDMRHIKMKKYVKQLMDKKIKQMDAA
jgi:1-acyl-sn-glycerol-3-phosphate acyltransferase